MDVHVVVYIKVAYSTCNDNKFCIQFASMAILKQNSCTVSDSLV